MEISQKKKNKYEIDMCSGNLFKKIVVFCFPLMLMGILQLLYNTADLIIVANFSDDPNALGAVGSTSSLINLVVNLFMGLSVGTNVICARYFGSKNKEGMSNAVHTSVLISIILGVLLGIIGFFIAGPLLHIMNNDDELSELYLKIYFIGMPFNLLYNFASSILRAVGDTKRPLYYLTIAGIANVILNIIFVIGFDMSVAGVALGTIISQAISAALVMIALMKCNESYGVRISKLKIHMKELLEITKVGLPAGIQSSIFSISNVLIQSSVNNFDKVATSLLGYNVSTVKNGNSAACSVEGFVYVAMNSVYHAALAFTGQNVGARKTKNIKKVTLYSLIYVTIVAVSLGVTLFVFGKQALSIYTTNPDEIAVGYIRLHYLCLPYFLCGIMDVMVGIIRGLGYGLTPMIVSIVGVCGFRVFWILFIFQNSTTFMDYNDLNLLYVSYPISWIITFAIHLITYFILSKKKYKELDNKLVLL